MTKSTGPRNGWERSAAQLVTAAAITLAVVVGAAGEANAAIAYVGGSVSSSGGWTYYNTIRTASGQVGYQPDNIIQANPSTDSYLALKITKTNGTYLGPVSEWFYVKDFRVIAQGMPPDTDFKMAACCKMNTTDLGWGGTMNW